MKESPKFQTCKRCEELGWKTVQPLYGIKGNSFCWTHAQEKILSIIATNLKNRLRREHGPGTK
jgi:hypothetical protein